MIISDIGYSLYIYYVYFLKDRLFSTLLYRLKNDDNDNNDLIISTILLQCVCK